MPNYKEYPGVSLGKDVEIGPFCVIGKPPREGGGKTMIGDNCTIRSGTVVYAGAEIGRGVQTGHGVLIREGNKIGDNTSIGTNSVLEYGNEIGENSRVHTSCFLENVRIGRDVFVGPRVVFTDDLHPPCPKYQECGQFVVVEDGAKIGANSTILPGVRIGRNALVGAGSVVTEDVKPGTVVAGSPARVLKSVKDLKCSQGLLEKPYQEGT